MQLDTTTIGASKTAGLSRAVEALDVLGFSFEPISEVDDLLLKRRDSPPPALHNRKPRTPQGGVFALGLCRVWEGRW